MKTRSDNSEMPPILVRLQQFIDKMKLSVYQVNKEAGLSKGLITNAMSKRQGLTTSTLEAILTAYPQLNANWLIVGRGEMLNEETLLASEQRDPSLTQQHIANLETLQQQCVELLKNIQQMKQNEQASADARLLESLGITQ